MSDSQAAQPKGKRSFDFSDILSMLEDRSKSRKQRELPPQEPQRELPPAAETSQEPVQNPAKKVIELGPSTLNEPQDSAIMAKLLADADRKNAEILRLNNELMQLKFDLREREQKIITLMAADAALKEKEQLIRERDAALAEKDAIIREKDNVIRERETALKGALSDKETALKGIMDDKEASVRGAEASLAAKDAEIKAYETKVKEMEARMREMDEQLGTLRKFSARENRDEFEEPAAAPATTTTEGPAVNIQEQMTPAPGEDDVAAIFKRLAVMKDAPPESEDGKEPPRRPRSAKLYDL